MKSISLILHHIRKLEFIWMRLLYSKTLTLKFLMRLLIDFPSFKDDNDDDDDDKDDNDVEASKCYLFLSMYFFLQYNIFSKEKFLKLRPSKAYFLL